MKRPSGEYTGLPSNAWLAAVMHVNAPPDAGTEHTSPLVLIASTWSRTATNASSFESGEKLMSSSPPRSSGGTSKSAVGVRSRGGALPSAAR